PPTRDGCAGIRGRQIGDQLAVGVEHLRADRNAHLHRLAGRAVLERAMAGIAASGLEPAATAEGGEISQVGIGNEDDVAAGAAVSSVGAAFRHMLLPPEVQAAVAAATRLNVDAGAVVKHAALLRGFADFHRPALAALTERDRAGTGCEDRVVATE